MRLRRTLFLEFLISMTFLGLLWQIAVPRYGEMKRRAVVASILGDVHAIRISAFSYYTEHGSFPPDAGLGLLPTELIENLPTGFSFQRPDYDYDWEVWSKTNSAGNRETLVGITVIVTDSRLAAQLVKTAGPGYIPVVTAKQVTFLVSSAS